MGKEVTVRFSLGSVVAVMALVAVTALALRIPGLLIEVFLACVLASAVLPLVRLLEERLHWGRGRAVVAAFLGVIVVVGGLGALVLPYFIDQTSGLVATVPKLSAAGEAWYMSMRAHYSFLQALPPLSNLPTRIGNSAAMVLGQGLDWVKRTVAIATAVSVVLVLGFFLLLDGPTLLKGLSSLVPPRHRALIEAQVDPIALKLGSYVQGTLTSITFYVVLQSVFLSIIGLPLALGVAFIAGVLEIIPIVGPVIGIVLGLAIAATVSVSTVLKVLAAFVVGRLIQDNVVNPYVFSHSLELPPTLVILSVLLGAELMGIAGALIAVPLLATVQVLVQNLYVANMQEVEEPGPSLAPRTPQLRVTFMDELERPVER